MRNLLTEKDINKAVAIYVRVSTTEQANEGYSIGEQTARIEKYCEAMGWNVYKVYTDAGFSGGNTERPALKQMIKDIKAGKVNKVVVYKLDRLSRSQKDTLYLIEDEFLKNNTDFVSMSENFDTSTPFGRAMIGILAVFAQLEREQIKERMSMGKHARAKEGKFHGSNKVPIGYDYINGKLKINEYERLQISKAFELIQKDLSYYQIANKLNESGYSHKYGKWHHLSVKRILRQKTYSGYINHKGEWLKGNHDSFISEETYNVVQNIIEERKRKHQELNLRVGKATSYLGGLLTCSNCTSKYGKVQREWKKKDGSRITKQYVCHSRSKRNKKLIKDPTCKNKKWVMEELDELIFNEIKKLSLDTSYFDEIKESSYRDDNSIIILQKEINKLDEQMSKLMDLFSLGNLPMNVLQDKINALNEKKEALENEIERISEEEQHILSKEETMLIIKSFNHALNNGNFDEIRSVITGLIEKIELDNDNVTIYWKFA